MTPLKFLTKINAPKEKVWSTLWNDITYRQWTAAFALGSHAVSDWNEGSKIKFLDGKGEGMHSINDKKVTDQQMTFKHMGYIKNGVETISGWAGSKENYFLSEANGVTELNVTLEAPEEFKKYFEEGFPKALDIVKQISEN
jgi:hypothetical protein